MQLTDCLAFTNDYARVALSLGMPLSRKRHEVLDVVSKDSPPYVRREFKLVCVT